MAIFYIMGFQANYVKRTHFPTLLVSLTFVEHTTKMPIPVKIILKECAINLLFFFIGKSQRIELILF